jgi:hypothetical protein
MSTRPFLKEVGAQLGAAAALLNGEVTEEMRGDTKLESLHTIYRFENGVCMKIDRRRDYASTDGRLLGMRLVGWMVEGTDGTRWLVDTWRQGAKGVLWRAIGNGGGTIALTSGTFAFVRDRTLKTLAAAPAALTTALPTESMTRVWPATA